MFKPGNLAIIVLPIVIAAGCTATPTPQQSIVVGVLAAVSGSDDAIRGAQLAVEVVNDDHPALRVPLAPGAGLPGLRGARLTLLSADTHGQTDQATRHANEFLTVRKASGMVLADSPEVAMSVASEVQRLRAPLIDAYNTADFLTELGMDWYFRAPPSDRSLVDDAFDLLRRQGVQRIAVALEAGGDSAAGQALIKAAADTAGIRIVPADGGAQQGTVAWAHTVDGATSLRRAAKGPVLGLGKGFRSLSQGGDGPALLRCVLWSAELAQRSPTAQAVAALYEKRFSQPMTDVAAATFTAMLALAVAIDGGGSPDPAAIRAALRRTNFTTAQTIMPWDGVRFSTDGHNSLASWAVEAWEGNAFRVIYPTEVAQRPFQWR